MNKYKNNIHLIDVSENIANNTESINRVLNNNSSYLTQFNLQTFDAEALPNAANDVYKTNNKARLADLERQLSSQEGWTQYNDDSMTYGVYSDDKLVHKNMVPNYSLKNGYGPNSLSSDSQKNFKNELFTGNLKSTWCKKNETKQFFKPVGNSTFVHGTPIRDDDEISRYIPSQYRQNETVFEKKQVTPGLNLDYHETGTHGYHSLYRPAEKTVDELRIKPKISYEGRVIEGMKGQARPIQAPVIQYKADTFKKMSSNDMLPTSSTVEGPKSQNNFIMKETDRDKQHIEYAGGAYDSSQSVGRNVPEHMLEKYKESQKSNFILPKPLQKFGKEETMYNANHKSYNMPDTVKDLTIHHNHSGFNNSGFSTYANLTDHAKDTLKELNSINVQGPTNITSNTMRGTVQSMDIANPTIKETMVENTINPFINGFNTMQRVYNSDNARTTIKESNINSITPGNVGQNNIGYSNLMDISKTTIRETFSQIPQNTFITPINQQQRAPDNQDITKNTMKETLNQIPRQTFYTPVNQIQGTVNLQDIAKTTMKEHTTQMPRQQMITPVNQSQGITNIQDNIRTTLKEQIVQIPYQSTITPVNQHQGRSNLQDISRTTIKEQTSQLPRQTMIMPVNQQQCSTHHQDIAKQTMKEIMTEMPRNNFISMVGQQQSNKFIQDIARQTTKETTVEIPYQTLVTPINQQQGRTNLQDIAKSTIKETLINIPYQLQVNAPNQFGSSSSFNRNPLQTTTKEQTVVIPYNNNITSVNQQQGRTSLQDIAKTTTREQLVSIPQNTQITPVNQQQRAPDHQDILRTTLKEQTIEIPYHNNVTAINKITGKGSTFSYTPLESTIKETMVDNNRINNASLDVINKGYGYLSSKMEAPTTNRQLTVEEMYINPILGSTKQRPYQDAYNMEINTNRENLHIYRKPTDSNVNLGPDLDHMCVRVLDDNNVSQEPMNKLGINNKQDRMKSDTFIKPTNYISSERYLDDIVLKQLETNPYHIKYY